MSQSSLDTLIDLATEQRDAAASALGQMRGRLVQSETQFDSLMAYRNEYQTRMEAAMANGVGMAELTNYQRFLVSLDQAIAQQERAVENSREQVSEGQTHWQDRHRRLKSFDALADRQRAAAARAEARREQQINDEAAGRMRRADFR